MNIECEYDIGQDVVDDLTQKLTKIIGMTYTEGRTCSNSKRHNVGSWMIVVDSDYLDGARHPWEVSAVCSHSSTRTKMGGEVCNDCHVLVGAVGDYPTKLHLTVKDG